MKAKVNKIGNYDQLLLEKKGINLLLRSKN
mgnify:CR=1 FL=1|jgi:hypothetical protein